MRLTKALLGKPAFPGTRGYNARIYRTLGASGTGSLRVARREHTEQ